MGNSDAAGRRRKSAPSKSLPSNADQDAIPDAAFDIWLHRGLHQLYDDVAREPVPDELLRIIEADRTKAAPDAADSDPSDPGGTAT